MSTDNYKAFSSEAMKSVNLEAERALILTSIAFNDNPTVSDKILADWINELKKRINILEEKL